MIENTICAVATPLGEGGIGIVRLSGPQALSIADQIFQTKKGEKLREIGTYQLRYGKVVDPLSGQMIDEALALVMRAPHSYTAEDVVEIQCHGGVVAVQEVLSLSLKLGAELAEPGSLPSGLFSTGVLTSARQKLSSILSVPKLA